MVPCLVVACVLLHAPPENPRITIPKAYDRLAEAFQRNDFVAIRGWCDKNLSETFTYTAKNKSRYKKDEFLKGLQDQTKQLKSVGTSTIRVDSLLVDATTATAVTSGQLVGNVIFDSQPLLLTNKSTSTDRWIKTGKGWRLDSIVVDKDDYQLQQRKKG